MRKILHILAMLLSAGAPSGFGAAPEFEGRTADQWITFGATNGPTESIRALDALREFGPDAALVVAAKLQEFMDNPRVMESPSGYSLWSFLLQSLIWLGPDAEPALPTLTRLMTNANWSPLLQSEAPLIRLKRDNPAMIQAAFQRLKNFEARLPTNGPMGLMLYFEGVGTLDDLGELGPAAREAVPVLRKWISDPTHELRPEATATLWRITGETNQTIPILLQYLKTGTFHDPCVAAEVFGEMGSSARVAVPDLTKALTFFTADDHPGTRSRAEDFISHGEMIPLDVIAARALWRITHQSELVLPTLVNNLYPQPNPLALKTLAEMGPAGERAVPKLIMLLDHFDTTIRLESIRTLGAVGPSARAAVPRLERLLADGLICIHLAAAEALIQIEPGNSLVLPKLVLWMKTGGAYSRMKSAELAGRIGPLARDAMPLLGELIADKNPRVQAAATGALKAIAVGATK